MVEGWGLVGWYCGFEWRCGSQKILHRGEGGTAEENLRETEAFTAEEQRAQRKARASLLLS
jgi:hypothetical protein